MTNFDDAELAKLFLQAKTAPRLRSHLLMHGGHDDPVQRLVIAARSGSYIRAHRHPEQWEMLAVLKGHLDFVLFTPDGEVTKRIALRPGDTTVLEIPPGQVHTGVVMEDETAVLEIKPGPYKATVFEDWAPEEGSPDAPAFMAWVAHAEIGARWTRR